MATPIENARSKIAEARFFVALMDRIEYSRNPLVPQFSADDEFVYLLSAFLNSCYSVTEYLKMDPSLKVAVKNFRTEHPDFYGSGLRGGLRTRAVHFGPVKPGHDGYIPPPGNNVIIRMRPVDKPSQSGGSADFHFENKGHYYFDGSSPQNCIWDHCGTHLNVLVGFVAKCAGEA